MTRPASAPVVVRTASRLRSRRALTTVAGVWLIAAVLIAGTFVLRDLRAGDRFDLVKWERTEIWNKWLFHVGAPLRNDLPDDEALRQFFALSDRRGSEARALENQVARIIERRIDAVASDLGLNARGIRLPGSVFPPVHISLATPPRVLVESPRDQIRRDSVTLMRTDLSHDDVLRIEHAVERDHPDRSALVIGTGGLAAYPAVVSAHRSYERAVRIAAHEWVHHYLAFYPLGIRYFTSPDVETMNETAADIIGDEIADIILERWGDPTVDPVVAEIDPEADPVEVEPFDWIPVMRDLRLDVDFLLLEGELEAAEELMEGTRRMLTEEGIFFRRINQAFFAWHGTYAARPDSVDPIGAQMYEIRDRAGSLTAFVELIRGMTARSDVRELRDELRARDGESGVEDAVEEDGDPLAGARALPAGDADAHVARSRPPQGSGRVDRGGRRGERLASRADL